MKLSIGLLLIASWAKHLYLESSIKSGDASVLIFVQGAQIDNIRYFPLIKEIQKRALFPLHVLLPDFFLDMAVPIGSYVHSTIQEAKKLLPKSHEMSVILCGHSLGASVAMDEGFNNTGAYQSLILMGATLNRKFNSSYPIPFLTINGELDGLQRVSRVAESFFNLYDRQRVLINQDSMVKQPIVILPGQNHMQFADGINPPFAVKKLDLKADVDIATAHQAIAQTVVDHICSVTKKSCDFVESLRSLQQKVEFTRQFLDPMIQGYRMEGSPKLFNACNSDTPSPHCPFYPTWPPQTKDRISSTDDQCICGVPFSSIAAAIMSGLDQSKYPIVNVDAIHDVTDTNPFHHPHVWSNCTGAQLPCPMNHTTVSQPMYKSDEYDTGFLSSTAYEIRVKFKSRQVFQLLSINTTARLDDTDTDRICAEINQRSYEWGLQHASPVALNRFKKYGQNMVMLNDYFPPLPIGPLWIYNDMKYKEMKIDGNWVMTVQSISFKTPEEGFVSKLKANGYHYCKVLSPARVMEWIYTDGLRRLNGI